METHKKYLRSGDMYLHAIKQSPKGLEEVKHNGKFVFGVGEASNHNHTVIVKNKEDLVIKKDINGDYYFELLADGEIAHLQGDSNQVAEHKTIPIKKGVYRQIHEREIDLFSKVARRVID
jgi:hypothetical protein